MIDILIDEEVDPHPLPSPARIRQAVVTALNTAGFSMAEDNTPELCIRFAPDAVVRMLNREWRKKDAVTDVLSFPQQEGPAFDLSQPLGDIVLAVPFVLGEAMNLGVNAEDHCLHLIIHASLHLVGFDHLRDADAAIMQALERQAMAALGLHDPYPDEDEGIR